MNTARPQSTVPLPHLAAWCLLSLAWSGAQAQAIYTCIDSKGRRLTSDRPIVECLDREQELRGKTGTVREVLPPSYTREERARIEEQRRAERDQEARRQEERRRERALLIRYPNKAVHDKERQEALAQIDDVIAAVAKRESALVAQRKEVDQEMEFYQADPSKAPQWLKRKVEDVEKQQAVQKRFLEEQALEKQRINARFDEELVKLRELWQTSGSASR